MQRPTIVSRDEWTAARKRLLVKDKEFNRQRDALSTERRKLPMVRIEKDYVFEGPTADARSAICSRAGASVLAASRSRVKITAVLSPSGRTDVPDVATERREER